MRAADTYHDIDGPACPLSPSSSASGQDHGVWPPLAPSRPRPLDFALAVPSLNTSTAGPSPRSSSAPMSHPQSWISITSHHSPGSPQHPVYVFIAHARSCFAWLFSVENESSPRVGFYGAPAIAPVAGRAPRIQNTCSMNEWMWSFPWVLRGVGCRPPNLKTMAVNQTSTNYSLWAKSNSLFLYSLRNKTVLYIFKWSKKIKKNNMT